MKIGVVSDSHGRAGPLRKALASLLARGAEAFVHCGDIGSSECIAALAEAGVPAYAVAGNMDRHVDQLQAEAERTGVHFSLDTVLMPLENGSYLAATHGSCSQTLRQLLSDKRFRYVCHGHTHRPRNERIGPTQVINPGALRHAHPTSVALLETETGRVEHIEVK
jgi:putative phosphoesterase